MGFLIYDGSAKSLFMKDFLSSIDVLNNNEVRSKTIKQGEKPTKYFFNLEKKEL